MTLRARTVNEGNTAVQAASKAVSHTTGSMKALLDTPGKNNKTKQNRTIKRIHRKST